MPKQSAGLLLYRVRDHQVEFFLVHPGGPFWAKKDAGAWSIPKGEIDEGEDALATARRELTEETGFVARGPFVPLPSIRQSGGKVVHAFAGEQDDIDPAKIVSNTFTIEWPPKSGRHQAFPEVDRAAWFSRSAAAEKINAAQSVWLAHIEADGVRTPT